MRWLKGRPYIQVGDIDRYVVTTWATPLQSWLDDGFERWVPHASRWGLNDVLPHCSRDDLRFMWRAAQLGREPPGEVTGWRVYRQLHLALTRRHAPLVMLGRRARRGLQQVLHIPELPEPSGPPVLDTTHWVVVEAVDDEEKAVPGLRLELVIAGGEVKSATTDSDGIARVEGIRAGRVVIRVPGLDGSRWRPETGEPSHASGSDSGCWHVVQRGESLSRIARQYGLESWRQLWSDPKNEPLRKTRKNPNVIHPGDDVHVPGVSVFEIVRATDAAHRIVVGLRHPAIALLNVHLLSTQSAVAVHCAQGETTFGAGNTTYEDEVSVVVRLCDVPERVQLALVAPPGDAVEAGAEGEAIAS
jgi:hypothetical protein